jgi:hypothetical protein
MFLKATPGSHFYEGLISLSPWERAGVREWSFFLQGFRMSEVEFCRSAGYRAHNK